MSASVPRGVVCAHQHPSNWGDAQGSHRDPPGGSLPGLVESDDGHAAHHLGKAVGAEAGCGELVDLGDLLAQLQHFLRQGVDHPRADRVPGQGGVLTFGRPERGCGQGVAAADLAVAQPCFQPPGADSDAARPGSGSRSARQWDEIAQIQGTLQDWEDAGGLPAPTVDLPDAVGDEIGPAIGEHPQRSTDVAAPGRGRATRRRSNRAGRTSHPNLRRGRRLDRPQTRVAAATASAGLSAAAAR